MRHPNIITYKEFIPEAGAIVMELASGNLNDLLSRLAKPLGWRLRLKWAMQISEALVFIHSKGGDTQSVCLR